MHPTPCLGNLQRLAPLLHHKERPESSTTAASVLEEGQSEASCSSFLRCPALSKSKAHRAARPTPAAQNPSPNRRRSPLLMRRTPSSSAPLRRPLPRGSLQEASSWHRGSGEMGLLPPPAPVSASESYGTSARRAVAARVCPHASSRLPPCPSSKLPGALPPWPRHGAPVSAASGDRDA